MSVKAVVVMTCFNRKEKTVNCINKLHQGNTDNEYRYIVVDDKSTDGTAEAISALPYTDVNIVSGSGSLFWNGGMYLGVTKAKEKFPEFDYIFLVNDDVDFYPAILDGMIRETADRFGDKAAETVLVGATCDNAGVLSYGGTIYTKRLHYDMAGPDRKDEMCSTFNANCAMIPMGVMKSVGNLDPYYRHSMGDFDLGFAIRRKGYGIYMFGEYVGVCNDNPIEGSWMDRSLGVKERIKLKETRKGLPFKDWFHYLHKNFGLGTAVLRSITPYFKIFMGK